jgi:3-oxoacyl-[acyl-carrier protein] reductase
MDLLESVVVVTGGAGGLGRRVCNAFAQHGAFLAIADRGRVPESEALGEELIGVGAGGWLAVDADLVQSESIAAMVGQIMAKWGRIDVLVNGAAINQHVPFSDLDALTEELWDMLVRSVLTGPFLCSKAVAPIMKRQGRGSIVNITSVAGFAPMGSSIAYACAKSGLAHLTRCLAVALAPEVTVNSVAPGLMAETPMGQKIGPAEMATFRSRAALGRTTKIDDVADQVVILARSDSTTGQNVLVDGGLFFH